MLKMVITTKNIMNDDNNNNTLFVVRLFAAFSQIGADYFMLSPEGVSRVAAANKHSSCKQPAKVFCVKANKFEIFFVK